MTLFLTEIARIDQLVTLYRSLSIEADLLLASISRPELLVPNLDRELSAQSRKEHRRFREILKIQKDIKVQIADCAIYGLTDCELAK